MMNMILAQCQCVSLSLVSARLTYLEVQIVSSWYTLYVALLQQPADFRSSERIDATIFHCFLPTEGYISVPDNQSIGSIDAIDD